MTTGNPPSEIRALRIVCIAMVMGVGLFAGIVLLIPVFDANDSAFFYNYSFTLFYVIAALALGCLLAARYLYSRKMQDIRNANVNIQGKLNLYRGALISYLAFCEFPALLATILYILTANKWLLLVPAVMVLAMVSKFPSKQKLVSDMVLDWKDEQELN